MRHIDTSIVSRHLATRDNNKILRTPPPALKRYFPASLVAPLPNSEQINHPSSKYTYTQSRRQNTSITTIPPSVTLTHTTHTPSLQLHPHTNHIVTPGIVDRPRLDECTAGQMDGEAGWWTTSGKIGLPTISKGHGSGLTTTT